MEKNNYNKQNIQSQAQANAADKLNKLHCNEVQKQQALTESYATR